MRWFRPASPLRHRSGTPTISPPLKRMLIGEHGRWAIKLKFYVAVRAGRKTMHDEGERRILRPASSLPTSLVLVKHAMPVREPAVAPRHWRLGLEGEHQSRRLASRLVAYAPLRLVASPEPKALMTGQLVAAELGLNVSAAAGLEEFDRPPLPLMPKAEHERIVAPIFGDLHRRVLGAESGRDALTRFSAAVDTELAQTDSAEPGGNHARHRHLAVRGGSQRHRRVRTLEAACMPFVRCSGRPIVFGSRDRVRGMTRYDARAVCPAAGNVPVCTSPALTVSTGATTLVGQAWRGEQSGPDRRHWW